MYFVQAATKLTTIYSFLNLKILVFAYFTRSMLVVFTKTVLPRTERLFVVVILCLECVMYVSISIILHFKF